MTSSFDTESPFITSSTSCFSENVTLRWFFPIKIMQIFKRTYEIKEKIDLNLRKLGW